MIRFATVLVASLTVGLTVFAQDKKGPLAGLPSKPGAHVEKIKAMGDNKWLELGVPAAAVVLQAWQQHGADYKRHLPLNRLWLDGAAARGWNVAGWLGALPWPTHVGGMQVQVGTECDPRQVFHMGDVFGTCLSLGASQGLSVLANAYDANKQVIYLTDHDRRVIRRQLIAISSEGGLLGYHCYVGLDNKAKQIREDCLKVMASYCGRLAAHCDIPLANQGKPAIISCPDWWDDGAWEWHASAREAWTAESEAVRS